MTRNNSTKNFHKGDSNGSFSSLMNKTSRDRNITSCRKTPNSKVHNSFNVGEIGTEPLTPYHRQTK